MFVVFFLFHGNFREYHSIFYIKNENLYEAVKKEEDFAFSFIFFLIENIPILKQRISTGEYEVNNGDSVFMIVKKMFRRERVKRKITFPEGLTVQMIIEIINNNPLLFGTISNIPDEASLMPDTYFYYFGDSKNTIVSKMKNQMRKILVELQTQNGTNLTIKEIVTLASIIEKETSIDEERRLISSVFHNRLAKKMRLQSDPTVVYAMSNGYGRIEGKLTRKDLWFESPYNTYRHGGLPPGAICCPGKDSIIAAILPAKTNYLYFVANSSNDGHIFTDDYDTHLKNVHSIKRNKTR
jgi:UPF0755 protein